MVMKTYNLSDWTLWQPGRLLPLPKDRARTVRLDVIAETATAFRVGTEDSYLEWEQGKREGPFGQLIAVLPHGGHGTVEFFGDGNLLLEATSDGEVMFYCSENTQWWVEYADEPSFTKPYERPLVDPAYQAMQIQMMRNMQAMEARISAGMRALRAPEPPATPVPERTARGQANAGNSENEAPAGAGGEENPPAGEKPPAGSKKPAKAPAGGGAIQPPASGEGD